MEKPIQVMVNGIPGSMATLIAKHALNDPRFALVPHSLTGPEIEKNEHPVESIAVNLIQPDKRETALNALTEEYSPFLTVDFTHPSAVNENAESYCQKGLPFVMGTTGGDRDRLMQTVEQSAIIAVIAPNMAKQIVGFQAMMEYGAKTFPDLFEGYTLSIKESHQQTKADTSGTAKAMVRYFNHMGLPFSEKDIEKIRDPRIQKDILGVPGEYLGGHGWHTYTIQSGDMTVKFEFTHNVNGRDIYAKGTLDALVYLNEKILAGEKGKVFSMIDVLKGV
jgi:4-hydroxy-tetrahydrodipicolinate reductase